ncbi:MAG: hypothetical protein M9938_07555 [Solirubrobacterales bacterium]|nr:hypothetical protein [Solirubrobacterales bacterium]
MAKEVFDQAQPHSDKARLFAEAFRGCDEWTIPPRKPRRNTRPVYSTPSHRAEIFDLNFRQAA